MKKIVLLLLLVATNAVAQTSLSETDKTAAWTKVWGFLKYFHPAVTHGTMNWDEVYVNELDSLKNIHSKEDLNTHFIGLIDNLNKQTELQWNSKDGMFVETILESLDEPIIFSDELIEKMRATALQRISGKNRFLDYFPSGYPLFFEENNYEENYYPETPYRLLALARMWSAVEFFFPFKKERITKGWSTVLKQQIPVFINAKDTLAYYKAIGSTLYELHDSHSAIIMHTKKYNALGDKILPTHFSFIEGKVFVDSRRIVSNKTEAEDELKYGDIILSIDGKSIENLINEYSLFKSGSNNDSKNKLILVDLLRGWNDIAEIEVIRDNQKQKLKVKRYADPTFEAFKEQPKTWEVINDDIGFIRLARTNAEDFKKALKKMNKFNHIILDMRYGKDVSLTYELFEEYFSADRKQFMNYQIVSKEIPSRFVDVSNLQGYVGKKHQPKYKGKLILLTDYYIQSAGETLLMAFQSFPNVTLVGSPTSGTNGEATLITLPGGFQFRMTSVMIHYLDGTPSVGNGIQPDILVKPTIEAMKNRKDEILEKAIEYAKKKS
ncbi:hypothetical protein H1R17_11205 [Flavobacterium sp. xlx-214]|uniref:S41 family peptidase n=1 Tax=unclassified Flavobacterium TaxID=196869 RepID=UPI0013D794F0|nr:MULTISPECIES: S41 family peptidase [unclassified Flavobacterium]MBA5791782.1 hypothetical protein [Flavobacterium sp. xlx-221]QMI83021.1 hypothetical protein H1R17_11205 [Flavobacterium sp. xlx-214]